jgi:hypothetical protein
MARHNSIFAAVACAAVALILAAAPAQANITWEWSFQSEAGTFVTNGDLIGGLAPAGSYTLDPTTFTVLTSSVPSLLGAGYTETYSPQGLVWDGSAVTQLWRDGGTYTNGANLFHVDYWYALGLPDAMLYDNTSPGDYFIALEGPLTLRPQSAVLVPVPGSICLVAAGLLSLRRLRRR